ncbi:hypothetical protein [Phenylobacterium sp.]|uniref:hypothetical protein n=1 Tax=Phenylobacterium sp. TaxID=1871053 RepID=UPI002F4187E5
MSSRIRHRRLALPAAALLAAAALSACQEGKPRHTPPDPMAGASPPVEDTPPPKALSEGLPKRAGTPIFTLDHVGAAFDPLGKPPAVTPRDRPVVFDGFGLDDLAKAPGRGVDVTVDGKVYGTAYGATRRDVAVHFKDQNLAPVGFRMVLPSGSLAVGPHSATVRVIAADGRSYEESPTIRFSVK